MGHERDVHLLQGPHIRLYTLGNLSSWRAPWADLCQVLESCQNPKGLHLPRVISASLIMGDNSSFNSGCGHSPNLEVTGWKQWPLSMILFPSTEPHEHGCDVSNVIIFSGALELQVSSIFWASYLIHGITLTKGGHVYPLALCCCNLVANLMEELISIVEWLSILECISLSFDA